MYILVRGGRYIVSTALQDIEELGRRDQLLSCFKENSYILKALAEVPEELLLKDEKELARIFKPTPMDYAMKKQLWAKFYEVEQSGEMRLKMIDIYGGICSNGYFYNELTKNHARLTWLFSPPIDTDALLEEAFRFSFERVRNDILTMPVTEKTAPILLKAFQYFADRHLGPMVQRIESKNLNVEMQAGKVETPTDPREIEERLREIKAKLLPVKDVTPNEE
jgi:hypothetical protein